MQKEKPVKIKYQQKVANDMMDLYLNPSSILHCEKCNERLGMFHTLRYALFKPQGFVYHVPCKACKHLNARTKGAYKTTVNSQWADLQAKLNAKRKP